jgi:hypothetical protein
VEKAIALAGELGAPVTYVSKHDLNMISDNRPHQACRSLMSAMHEMSIPPPQMQSRNKISEQHSVCLASGHQQTFLQQARHAMRVPGLVHTSYTLRIPCVQQGSLAGKRSSGAHTWLL